MPFDANNLVITIPIRSQGIKTCKLRWPTDAQWSAYFRERQDVRRFLGRGKSENATLNVAASNAKLFNAIRQDMDGEPFDDAMIEEALDRLQSFEFEEPVRDGDQWSLSCTALDVFSVDFILNEPTLKQIKTVRDKCFRKFDRGNSTYLTTHLGPAAELFDTLFVATVGYVSTTPSIHKFGVVFRLIRAIEQEAEEAQSVAGE